MLEHDYILEIITQFVDSVSIVLRRAVIKHDEVAAREVENAVAELIDLDPETAMQLAPDSLVTMMILSGLGDSVASYACYALEKVALAYEEMGQDDLAHVRHAQANAVAESFACDVNDIPAEFIELDKELALPGE